MTLSFPFQKEKPLLFGNTYRPIAKVSFWSRKFNIWDEITMIVDTGADYIVLSHYLAEELGIDLEQGCSVFYTSGVGGKEIVYVLEKQRVKLGKWEREIPVGFLEKDTIPPLMGRQLFLETFESHFSKSHVVSFSE